MAETASAIKLIDGSKRGVRVRKKPVGGTVTANKRNAETTCGHPVCTADATAGLLLCPVDMIPLSLPNIANRDGALRERKVWLSDQTNEFNYRFATTFLLLERGRSG
jgi:hypothetical protein